MENKTNIFDVDLHNFDDKVIKRSHDITVLVDFWAEWCGPCHMLDPHLKKAVQPFSSILELAKLEAEDENMKMAGKYKVRGFPTVIMFRNGDEVARFSSAKPTHWISDWIEEHLPDSAIRSL